MITAGSRRKIGPKAKGLRRCLKKIRIKKAEPNPLPRMD
jgi:hypothetical protein